MSANTVLRRIYHAVRLLISACFSLQAGASIYLCWYRYKLAVALRGLQFICFFQSIVFPTLSGGKRVIFRQRRTL